MKLLYITGYKNQLSGIRALRFATRLLGDEAMRVDHGKTFLKHVSEKGWGLLWQGESVENEHVAAIADAFEREGVKFEWTDKAKLHAVPDEVETAAEPDDELSAQPITELMPYKIALVFLASMNGNAGGARAMAALMSHHLDSEESNLYGDAQDVIKQTFPNLEV